MTRTITVKGIGSISAKPDYITLSLSIDAKDMDYEKAMCQAVFGKIGMQKKVSKSA